MTIPVVMCWSGGKDSALALKELIHSNDYHVIALLTTLTREFDRIAMHGVRRELLVEQAKSIGIPLVEAWITAGADNDEYESVMGEHLSQFRNRGVCVVAFGDLFLQDIREYRERLVSRLNMTPIFPVWGRNTASLAIEFVNAGFRAKTCCVDTAAIDESFFVRDLNDAFFQELPEAVDACGENGEFHTFVFDGPFFRYPISLSTGECHHDGQFVFRDLISSADCS